MKKLTFLLITLIFITNEFVFSKDIFIIRPIDYAALSNLQDLYSGSFKADDEWQNTDTLPNEYHNFNYLRYTIDSTYIENDNEINLMKLVKLNLNGDYLIQKKEGEIYFSDVESFSFGWAKSEYPLPKIILPKAKEVLFYQYEFNGPWQDFDFPEVEEITLVGLKGNYNDLKLTKMPKLREILAFDNNFNGNIELDLPNLENLQLHFQDNFSNDNFTCSLEFLNNLPNIKRFSCRFVGMGGVIPKLDCPKLESLDLFFNNFGGEFPDLSGCPNLVLINLHKNGITGELPDLSYHKSLKIIELTDNAVGGKLPNLDMPQLTGLYMSANPISELPDKMNLPNAKIILEQSKIKEVNMIEDYVFSELNLNRCYLPINEALEFCSVSGKVKAKQQNHEHKIIKEGNVLSPEIIDERVEYVWYKLNGEFNQSTEVGEGNYYYVKEKGEYYYEGYIKCNNFIDAGFRNGVSERLFIEPNSIKEYENDFSMFPNPVDDNLNIELNKNYKILEYKIYSSNGKIIKSENLDFLDNKININTNHLVTGVYFIEIKTNSQNINKSFIKRH